MSFIREDEECITVFLSIGDIVEYESEIGIEEGEILEIDESSNAVKILSLSEDLILIPIWINGESIIPS